MPEECIFCKIVNKQLPANLIMESAVGMAILDIYPITSGHTLIFPKKHYAQFQDIPENELNQLIQMVQQVAKIVPGAVGAKDYNIGLNNGKNANQFIFHAHFHLIPRKEGDREKHSGMHANDKELKEVLKKIKQL